MSIRCFTIILSLFFLEGCLDYKKNNDKEKEKNAFYSIVTHYEKISQEDAILLGFIWLPVFLEQLLWKKSDSLYVVDTVYEGNLVSWGESYALLKKMYIDYGWTISEEVETDSYIHVFLKKVDKEMVLFVEERVRYDAKTKKNSVDIFLHQSLLIL